jgi:single-stranded-DNA-specific exonuclease
VLNSLKKWRDHPIHKEEIKRLAESIGHSELVANLLYNRGFQTPEDAHAFLHSESLPYHDPFIMLGMEKAVERVSEAIENFEHILVFGDYDADGVTSTSLLVLALRELGAEVSYYIPDRFKEGYGPNIPAIERAKEQGVSLVITVDTGISAVDVAKRAKEIGLDYIVTDHHEPPPDLPEAFAIINPKQPGCPYPFKSLAGVGVAVKVVQALMEEVPTHLLDLAAVGTISDLVPLVEENRRLVIDGLKVLNHSPKVGLQALLNLAGTTEPGQVDSDVIGFQIGPRLNAAGRLAHASLSADLLMSEEEREAERLAEKVNQLNVERKELVASITKEAIAAVERFPEDQRAFIIIAQENWHEGVLGIVASRLAELYYRPTLVLSIHPETGMAKGSARSIEGFDLFQALSTARDLLPHFGGHEMAAGLSLPKEDVDELRDRMNRYAKQVFTEELLIPKVTVDRTLQLSEISIEQIEELSILAPYGVGNPKPKFRLDQLAIKDIKQIGAQKDHLKLTFTDSDHTLESISFGKGDLFYEMVPEASLSVIGELGVNQWNGFRKPQLFVEDFRIDHFQVFDLRGTKTAHRHLSVLEPDACLQVYFCEETMSQSDQVQLGHSVHFRTVLDTSLQAKNLVLLDLPEALEDLKQLLQTQNQLERLYLLFEHKEDHFFEGMPSREHFKAIYSLFHQHQQLEVSKLRQWAKTKGWAPKMMDFIIKVFLELEFVRIEKDVLYRNPSPEKKPLTSSLTYQQRQVQIEVEEFLLYSPRGTLIEWFDKVIENRKVSKEDVLI